MKNKSYIVTALMGAAALSGCSTDKFAEINTDPSVVSKGNIVYLTTKGMLKFEPSEYTFWYYNAKNFSQFAQSSVPTSGFRSDFNELGASGSQGQQTLEVQRFFREVENVMKQMPAEEAAKYEQIRNMFYPMMVYLGIFDTDVLGEMPYTEAGLAPYTEPMLLTPKYDELPALYDLWISQLNTAIDNLTKNHEQTQITMGAQDFIYKGDVKKWAKFANSLKLKLAVRLLHADKAKAISIAEEAAKNPAGLLNGLDDDFIYNQGTLQYHFGDNASLGVGSKKFIDLLKKNWDPRVRFFFAKNDFNGKVVQAFFDANKELPAYIAENVVFEEVDGKKKFIRWQGQEEPWTRYYGIPSEMNAGQQGIYADYFDNNRWRINLNNAEKVYTPYSIFQEEMIHGQLDYTYPDYPGVVNQDKDDNSWHGLHFSTAEVNLYLAELKLLGANLPLSAEDYYNKAMEMSVKAYNKLAGLNKIPYYDNVYDKTKDLDIKEEDKQIIEKPIKLQDGELEKMMEQEDYKLTGNKAQQLEKVYLQQYIHFYMQPTDQFVSMRRSGIPSKNSTIYAWEDLKANTEIPRRLQIGDPSPSDLMRKNKIESAERQGFTLGSRDASVLNSERIWFDKGAPNFGEGPNIN
ncbi:MAG: SusD/RagB family nutrient-binding outer membrane lipoprotein [Tannerellaceae bacterium]